MALLEDLNWRHALKGYDTTKQVSVEDLQKIIEAMRLAPTSSGLQPFKVLLVADKDMKEKVATSCYSTNGAYVKESSYTLILAGWNRYTEDRIDKVFEKNALERDMPIERYANYAGMLKQTYVHQQSAEENFAHISRQVYIALGLGLAQAAELRIGSTPIEGFDPKKLDELLDLDAKGLRSLCLITLGYSDPEKDWLASMKKVRRPLNHFLIEL